LELTCAKLKAEVKRKYKRRKGNRNDLNGPQATQNWAILRIAGSEKLFIIS
jgi:hypothetical protein